jgi:hypothetical protein
LALRRQIINERRHFGGEDVVCEETLSVKQESVRKRLSVGEEVLRGGV